jgi:hypothetical protein
MQSKRNHDSDNNDDNETAKTHRAKMAATKEGSKAAKELKLKKKEK